MPVPRDSGTRRIQHKLYVGGIDASVTRGDLSKEFGRFGDLQDVWVARNPPGFAFVEFERRRDAISAVQALDDTNLLGGRIRVEFAKAEHGSGGAGGGHDGGSATMNRSSGRGNRIVSLAEQASIMPLMSMTSQPTPSILALIPSEKKQRVFIDPSKPVVPLMDLIAEADRDRMKRRRSVENRDVRRSSNRHSPVGRDSPRNRRSSRQSSRSYSRRSNSRRSSQRDSRSRTPRREPVGRTPPRARSDSRGSLNNSVISSRGASQSSRSASNHSRSSASSGRAPDRQRYSHARSSRSASLRQHSRTNSSVRDHNRRASSSRSRGHSSSRSASPRQSASRSRSYSRGQVYPAARYSQSPPQRNVVRRSLTPNNCYSPSPVKIKKRPVTPPPPRHARDHSDDSRRRTSSSPSPRRGTRSPTPHERQYAHQSSSPRRRLPAIPSPVIVKREYSYSPGSRNRNSSSSRSSSPPRKKPLPLSPRRRGSVSPRNRRSPSPPAKRRISPRSPVTRRPVVRSPVSQASSSPHRRPHSPDSRSRSPPPRSRLPLSPAPMATRKQRHSDSPPSQRARCWTPPARGGQSRSRSPLKRRDEAKSSISPWPQRQQNKNWSSRSPPARYQALASASPPQRRSPRALPRAYASPSPPPRRRPKTPPLPAPASRSPVWHSRVADNFCRDSPRRNSGGGASGYPKQSARVPSPNTRLKRLAGISDSPPPPPVGSSWRPAEGSSSYQQQRSPSFTRARLLPPPPKANSRALSPFRRNSPFRGASPKYNNGNAVRASPHRNNRGKSPSPQRFRRGVTPPGRGPHSPPPRTTSDRGNSSGTNLQTGHGGGSSPGRRWRNRDSPVRVKPNSPVSWKNKDSTPIFVPKAAVIPAMGLPPMAAILGRGERQGSRKRSRDRARPPRRRR